MGIQANSQHRHNLEQLGFSSADAEVYLSLLKEGQTSVGPLIERTGLHRESVYGALRRLEVQGLVQSLEKKKIRHYQAIDPQVIIKKTKEKTLLAEALVPDLKKLFQQIPTTITVFEGEEGFEEIQIDVDRSLKDGEGWDIIGAAGFAWYEVNKAFYKRYHKKRIERKIKARMLTFQNEVQGILENELPGFCTLRALPQEFATPSETQIYADKIVIEVFGDAPVAILIRSLPIANSYRQYFLTLWNMAKPVKEYNSKK